MPGPAVTVEILGDTSGLDTALAKPPTKLNSFIAGFTSAFGKIGGVGGAIDLAIQGFDKLVELGGPEAQQAVADMQKSFSDELAPVLAELTPLIVDLVKGLTELMKAVLPVLVPALGLLVSALRLIFDWAGFVIGYFGGLITTAKDLIDNALDLLWEKLDAIRGMFDLVWQAVETVIKWFGDMLQPIRDLLGPIGEVVSAVLGLVGDLGEALGLTEDVSAAAQGLGGGRRSGGSFPTGPGGTVTVNTGADPNAVVRAIRRYSASNGGARSFQRHAMGIRGH